MNKWVNQAKMFDPLDEFFAIIYMAQDALHFISY